MGIMEFIRKSKEGFKERQEEKLIANSIAQEKQMRANEAELKRLNIINTRNEAYNKQQESLKIARDKAPKTGLSLALQKINTAKQQMQKNKGHPRGFFANELGKEQTEKVNAPNLGSSPFGQEPKTIVKEKTEKKKFNPFEGSNF